MENKKTYTLEFTCYNCSTSYATEIEYGIIADGRGEHCPYCGVEDSQTQPFHYTKPKWIRYAESMAEAFPKGK